MNIFVTEAKGKRTCKKDKDSVFVENPPKRINRGDKILVISNGAFGQLEQYDNYSKDAAIKLLEGLLDELKERYIYKVDEAFDDIPF